MWLCLRSKSLKNTLRTSWRSNWWKRHFTIHYRLSFIYLAKPRPMEKRVRLNDKSFRLYKSENEILTAVRNVAHQINEDYIGKRPLLIPVLNGSFMFASDLIKELMLDCELCFIKASSYHGTNSTGNVSSVLGLNENIEGRHIIIIEDIVDTGNTLAKILPPFQEKNPASIKILSSPSAFTCLATCWEPGTIITCTFPFFFLSLLFVWLYRGAGNWSISTAINVTGAIAFTALFLIYCRHTLIFWYLQSTSIFWKQSESQNSRTGTSFENTVQSVIQRP